MTIKQLEAAFPYPTGDTTHHPGMDLRDWFAGQAIVGFACPDENAAVETVRSTDPATDATRAKAIADVRIRGARTACREAAELAYMLADALLYAREKRND